MSSPDKAAAPAPTAATPTAGEEKGPDGTPARQLNANAKSFVPRLESTPKTPGKGKNHSNNANHTANATGGGQPASAAGVASAPSPNARAHPIPPLLPPFGVPPLAALGAPPLGFPGVPGIINPLMMSPMLVAALSASARGGMVSPFVPQVPTTPLSPVAPSVVNVGNASLQALRAGGPAKFACVLIVGMPRVGKTTIGRNLVQQLEQDGLSWSFFSGGDYIKEGSRAAPWDTTKEIFDALSHKIDDLQAQASNTVRGLIIDKQCRGTEELYYLTALLRSKGLHLNGVVGLVADDDQKLADRLGESDPAFKEKCKFHRVIQTRIREVCKAVGLWHAVDALEDADTVVRKVRSMVLGCSSQIPHKHLSAASYHDSQSPMVDNYDTYASVLNTVVSAMASRMQKATQFPGFVNFTPLSNAAVAKKALFKDYAVRRRSDGTKYILVYDGTAMYLVPRHMRCAFNLKLEAWLGVPLNNVAKFVLDGDLVRLSKERTREKFLVQDMLCWIDKGSTTNLVARSTWKERQEKLTVNICGEDSAFYGNCEVVVVHQTFTEFKSAEKLFEPVDYPTDGFVFQPTLKREDPVYIWRPPESITVDFRLGPVISAADGARKYTLQVFDQSSARFVAYGTDTVTIPDSRQYVVEGALTICSLKPDEAAKTSGREWTYVRTRTDIPTSAFKSYVDDLLTNCLVPKATVAALLGVDPSQPRLAAPAATDAAPATPLAATTAPAQQPAAATTTAVPTPSFQQQNRNVFGSALNEPVSLAVLNSVVNNVHVVPGTVVPGTSASAAALPPPGRKPRGPTPAEAPVTTAPAAVPVVKKQKCWDCGKVGEGDVDTGDHKFYCLDCWAVFETADAKAAKNNGGNRNSNNRGGNRQPRKEATATEAAAPSSDAPPAEHKKTRRGGGGKKESGKVTPTPEQPAATA